MKAQVSVEYLIIVSVALVVLLPLILYSGEILRNYNEETRMSLAKNAVKKIGESADWVYSQGPPAKLNTEVYFPSGISQTSLENNAILLKMKVSSGTSDIYYSTMSPLNGSIPSVPGYYTITLVAYQDYVNISW
ncbi:MAG TPA: hypothetical protein VJ343_02245 [archaeon]|nr:hypothetical protein [archaeon]